MFVSAFRRPQWRTTVPLGAIVLALILSLFFSLASHMSTFAAAPQATAPDGPGTLSRFDLARKDCVGTARNTTSKVWYTLAGGVLSDVYYPTIDNTNVHTLQYIVTDGSTFTDVQTRDTTYTVELLDKHALDCRVTATANNGKYRIITDYLTDPQRNTVAMQVRFQALVGSRSNYKFYVRYEPIINGNGGGGASNGGGDSTTLDTSTGHVIPIAYDTNTKSNAANRDYAVPVYSALDASKPFLQASNGFAGGASDGQTQLDASHQLTSLYTQALNGHVAQTVQLDFSQGDKVALALGFGTDQKSAINAAEGTLGTEFEKTQRSFERAWDKYDEGLVEPPSSLKGTTKAQWTALVKQYYLSANVIKASEDKTFAGAEVASLASPWGQAV